MNITFFMTETRVLTIYVIKDFLYQWHDIYEIVWCPATILFYSYEKNLKTLRARLYVQFYHHHFVVMNTSKRQNMFTISYSWDLSPSCRWRIELCYKLYITKSLVLCGLLVNHKMINNVNYHFWSLIKICHMIACRWNFVFKAMYKYFRFVQRVLTFTYVKPVTRPIEHFRGDNYLYTSLFNN